MFGPGIGVFPEVFAAAQVHPPEVLVRDSTWISLKMAMLEMGRAGITWDITAEDKTAVGVNYQGISWDRQACLKLARRTCWASMSWLGRKRSLQHLRYHHMLLLTYVTVFVILDFASVDV